MTSMSTRSQMERKPRAPVPCSTASLRDGAQGVVRRRRARTSRSSNMRGVLLDERVLRLGEDAHQIVLGQAASSERDHRDTAHELGNHAELVQVLAAAPASSSSASASFFDFGACSELKPMPRLADALGR